MPGLCIINFIFMPFIKFVKIRNTRQQTLNSSISLGIPDKTLGSEIMPQARAEFSRFCPTRAGLARVRGLQRSTHNVLLCKPSWKKTPERVTLFVPVWEHLGDGGVPDTARRDHVFDSMGRHTKRSHIHPVPRLKKKKKKVQRENLKALRVQQAAQTTSLFLFRTLTSKAKHRTQATQPWTGQYE